MDEAFWKSVICLNVNYSVACLLVLSKTKQMLLLKILLDKLAMKFSGEIKGCNLS